MPAGTVKCLACRRPVHSTGGNSEDGPALCEDCAVEDGVREGVLLELLGEQRRLEQRNCTANSLCMNCHSGGLTGKVLCENGECPVRKWPTLCINEGLCMIKCSAKFGILFGMRLYWLPSLCSLCATGAVRAPLNGRKAQ